MALPFSVSPDPLYLYVTPGIQATLTKCKYVIENRQGLTTILGDVGLGKSTVMRTLWNEYEFERDDAVAVLIPTPKFSSDFAFLKALAAEFGVRSRRSMLEQEQELREELMRLFSEGKNAVVFIDEAQNLKGPMLEQIRTLLNFETNSAKLVQVVLAGQLELRDRLKDPTKKAIRSRIFASSTLDPLTLEETSAMLAHRCKVTSTENPFDTPAIEAVYQVTSGVPRDILKVCALAMELASALGGAKITPEIIADAAYETQVQ